MCVLCIIVPCTDFMISATCSLHVTAASALYAAGKSRCHICWPTAHICPISALADLTEAGIRFHKYLALHLEITNYVYRMLSATNTSFKVQQQYLQIILI